MEHSSRCICRLGKHESNHRTSVVNDFNTFTTNPRDYVASALNQYKIMVNNMTTHGMVQTPIEYNLKFINSLRKVCVTSSLVFRVIDI